MGWASEIIGSQIMNIEKEFVLFRFEECVGRFGPVYTLLWV